MKTTSELNSSRIKRRLASRIDRGFVMEAFGVRVAFESNCDEALDACRKILDAALPGCYRILAAEDAEHSYALIWNESRRDSLYKDGEPVALRTRRGLVLSMLEPRIRLTVAEFAKDRIFIHAGVVVFGGKTLVLPGGSMSGKTSLVMELVKNGAIYYSDEYAIVGKNGKVYPFAKTLSVRGIIDDYQQVEHSVNSIGGRTGRKPRKIDVVLFSDFRKRARFAPRRMGTGEAIMEMVRNTVGIRQHPELALSILKVIADHSIVYKTKEATPSIASSPY